MASIDPTSLNAMILSKLAKLTGKDKSHQIEAIRSNLNIESATLKDDDIFIHYGCIELLTSLLTDHYIIALGGKNVPFTERIQDFLHHLKEGTVLEISAEKLSMVKQDLLKHVIEIYPITTLQCMFSEDTDHCG